MNTLFLYMYKKKNEIIYFVAIKVINHVILYLLNKLKTNEVNCIISNWCNLR